MSESPVGISRSFIDNNYPNVAALLLDSRQKIIILCFFMLLTYLLAFSGSQEGSEIILSGIALVLVWLMNIASFHRLLAITCKSSIPGFHDLPRRPDEALPKYSVLVPLYREGCIVKNTVENLKQLDYPKEKLEIFLLIEAIDEDTRAALPVLPDFIKVIDIINPAPKGKPYALNCGLEKVTGDLLTVYDAEDRPEPQQLKKAVATFDFLGPKFWAIQARLRFANQQVNWLTRFFSAEYNYWHDIYLPFLFSRDYPVPLGGTSNHVRLNRLREIGGWDAHNVTEDADLTIRICKKGGKIGLLNSETYEQSPTRIKTWIKQRTRWIKGLIQTFLVHSRSELSPQLIKYLLFCYSGIFLVCYCVLHGIILTITDNYYAEWLAVLSLSANLVFTTVISIKAYKREHLLLKLMIIPSIPIYWIMYLVANARALYQLFENPYLWEKTDHNAGA
ncbi:MAG: glycosyltransferase [Victivallaceae bacterium]|nr:glycosyltransferase [Victivallaceae bacterium]